MDVDLQLNMSITRIPQEILSEIFLIVSDIGRYRKGRWNPWGGQEIIVFITLVCRHWRTVALEMPILWTHICLDKYGLEQLTTYLTRSASLPLTIVTKQRHSRSSIHPRFLNIMDEGGHSARVRTLWIFVIGISDEFSYCPLKIVSLDSLILHLDVRVPSAAYSNLFLNQLSDPYIKSITLIEVGYPKILLAPEYFTNIRYLTYVNSPQNYTIASFLDTIRLCSSLEVLQIHNFHGSLSYRRDEQPDTVDLPKLRLLQTSFAIEETSYLLNFLKIYDAAWDIKCSFPSSFSFAVKLIPQNIPKVLSARLIGIGIGKNHFEVEVDSKGKIGAYTGAARSRLPAFMDGCFRQLTSLIPSRIPPVTEIHFSISGENTTLPRPDVWAALVRKMVNWEVLRFEITDLLPLEELKYLQTGVIAYLEIILGDVQTSKHFLSLKALELVYFDFSDSLADFNSSLVELLLAFSDGNIIREKIEIRLINSKFLGVSMVAKLKACINVALKPRER